jgi:hypothetical protein
MSSNTNIAHDYPEVDKAFTRAAFYWGAIEDVAWLVAFYAKKDAYCGQD